MEWPRGEATACKAVYTGSNPVSTSMVDWRSWLARFLDMEEVTGSSPVSTTRVNSNQIPDSARLSAIKLSNIFCDSPPKAFLD